MDQNNSASNGFYLSLVKISPKVKRAEFIESRLEVVVVAQSLRQTPSWNAKFELQTLDEEQVDPTKLVINRQSSNSSKLELLMVQNF